jgi:hypothetical protein
VQTAWDFRWDAPVLDYKSRLFSPAILSKTGVPRRFWFIFARHALAARRQLNRVAFYPANLYEYLRG